VWDPEQYHRYSDERARPFHDLLARVGATEPARVVDLGCGTGELTALLAARWPGAVVEGVDSSPAMLARARPGDRLRFTVGDVERWRAAEPADVVVCSAALQWVDDHEDVLRRLVDGLAAGGWLAVQVPGNFAGASHVLLREVAARRLPGLPLRVAPVLDPAGYAELLADVGCSVDAWETTYLHLLAGADPILEWLRGTALRPVLAELPAAGHDGFLAELGAALRTAYPAGRPGTMFPFRRVFVVARSPR